jgi:hypothetical protein
LEEKRNNDVLYARLSEHDEESENRRLTNPRYSSRRNSKFLSRDTAHTGPQGDECAKSPRRIVRAEIGRTDKDTLRKVQDTFAGCISIFRRLSTSEMDILRVSIEIRP